MAAILPAFVLHAERQSYERYQSIVDRQMFGQPPAGFDPTKNPSEVSAKDAREKDLALTKEQEQVKSSIHFSVINVTPSGETAVGFTDNSDSKSPKHYYLKVGETRDGWTVKDADALAASMTIAKGEIEVSLTIGGDSSSGTGTKRVAGGAAGSKSSDGASRLSGGSRNGLTRNLGTLRERRAERQRKRDEVAAQEKAEREREREAEKAEREREREAERAEREKAFEEQRAQLMLLKEDIRASREKLEAEKKQDGEKQDGDNPNDGGE